MLRNYLKIAFRNLLRHKAYSFINIFGLAIGMACSIMILLWVQDELSYDRFFKNSDRIYRLDASLPALDVHAAVSSAPLAQAIREQLPEVEQTVRINAGGNTDVMQVGDRLFEEKRIIYADSTFFDMFSYPMLEGDRKTALLNPDGIVITESMARKYFGDQDPLGKTIRKEHKDDLTVTGVLANLPSNTHLKFDFVIPMAFLARTNNDLKNNVWDNFNFYTYVRLHDNVDASSANLDSLASRIRRIYKANESQLKVAFSLQHLTDVHLHSQGLLADLPGGNDVQYVYILTVIAVFILIVACINFMNLATARSARRAKEVGLRKVAGAVRIQLIRQFLAESAMIAFLSLILAIIIVAAAMPGFNELAGKQLSLNLLDGRLILGLIAITLTTGLLAGSYPALYLSGFMPASVLKGKMKAGNVVQFLRNGLVVFQFVISIALLVGTAVIYRQMNFIQSRDLGYNKENLLYVEMHGDLWNKYHAFRTALASDPLTKNFSVVGDLPTNLMNATVGVEWPGKDPNSQPLFSNMAVDENFVNVFQVKMLAGRNYYPDQPADSTGLIVNEEALKIFGLTPDKAIGTPVKLWDKEDKIIGVVKDFNFKPAINPIDPMILHLDNWGGTAVVRTKPNETEATIAALKRIWQDLNPDYPFSYGFLDQDLANLYQSQTRLGTLFDLFAGLAIFISCLGLYGLSAFLAERRTKEIGVRKVLGASTSQVMYILSMSFTRPVVVAMFIAAPLSWYAMRQWLQGFAFHITIGWDVFVIASLAAFLIAWITISYESIKAASANPAESLRSE